MIEQNNFKIIRKAYTSKVIEQYNLKEKEKYIKVK